MSDYDPADVARGLASDTSERRVRRALLAAYYAGVRDMRAAAMDAIRTRDMRIPDSDAEIKP